MKRARVKIFMLPNWSHVVEFPASSKSAICLICVPVHGGERQFNVYMYEDGLLRMEEVVGNKRIKENP